MGLALAFDTESDHLAAPTETMTVPPINVERAREVDSTEFSPLEGVIEHARALTEKNPDSPSAFSRLAQSELNAGFLQEAAEHSLKALDLANSTQDHSAAIAAAQVLAALGRIEDAERALRSVGTETRGAAYVYAGLATARGDYEAAIGRLGEWIDPATDSLRGWLLLELRDWNGAIRNLRRAARKGTYSPDILVNLGYSYAALGLRKKAIQTTREALYLAPGDKTAAFNLVSYYMADKSFEKALSLLKEITAIHPNDFEVMAAVADVKYQCGKGEDALRGLQHALARAAARDAEALDRAELMANIAYLEWRLRRRTKQKTVESLRRELLRCDYKSLGIARMLASLLSRRTDAHQLNTLIEGLKDQVSPLELYGFEVQLRYLEGRFDEALNLTLKWNTTDPFDPVASTTAVFLLCDLRFEFEKAAELGLEALKRFPHHEMLLNNTAYALAFARRGDEALKLLPSKASSPYQRATRALVDISAGRVEEGVEGYEEAIKMAQEADDEDEALLPDLIRLKKNLVLSHFGYPINSKELSLPVPNEEDPRVPLFERMAREVLDRLTNRGSGSSH